MLTTYISHEDMLRGKLPAKKYCAALSSTSTCEAPNRAANFSTARRAGSGPSYCPLNMHVGSQRCCKCERRCSVASPLPFRPHGDNLGDVCRPEQLFQVLLDVKVCQHVEPQLDDVSSSFGYTLYVVHCLYEGLGCHACAQHCFAG